MQTVITNKIFKIMPAPCIITALGTPVNGVCSSQLAGVEAVSVLIPVSRINRTTLAYDNDSVIVNTLALTSGTGAKITVSGDMPYSDMAINGTMGTYIQLFESIFAFPILGNSPQTAKQVTQLGNDHYVAVVQFKGWSAANKNKYGIIGLNRGLKFRTGNWTNTSQDEFGWKIELAEADGIVPLHFYWPTAGEAAADAWFAGLLPA